MIPAAFDYQRPESVEHAIELLEQHGEDAKLLAGGQSLLPLMKLRLAVPAVVVDVGRLPDLRYIRDEGGHVAVGALTLHRDLETSDVVSQHVPVVSGAARVVGDRQVRNRGTLGGTLAHGDPASDLPAAVLAAGGTIVITGRNGSRSVDVADFFTGFLDTVVEPGEMITEVRLPKATGGGWSYQKFRRRAQDWAIVGVAAARDGDTTRLALVNMGPTPMRARAVEEALAGGATPEDAASLAADGSEPPTDLHAGVEYREHLARVLTQRAIEECERRARGEDE